MKKIFLITLLPFFTLIGCDQDKEKKNKSNNIVTTPPKHWGINDLDAPMKRFQEEQKRRQNAQKSAVSQKPKEQ